MMGAARGLPLPTQAVWDQIVQTIRDIQPSISEQLKELDARKAAVDEANKALDQRQAALDHRAAELEKAAQDQSRRLADEEKALVAEYAEKNRLLQRDQQAVAASK